MYHRVIGIVLFLSLTAAVAQDHTPQQGAGKRGHFGAPVVKYTVLRDQGAVMFGGRGGWNPTPSLLIGGGVYATVSEVDARGGVIPETPGPIDLKFDSFGFDLEYAHHPTAPTHLTLTMFFGGAAARYAKDKTDEQQGETDFMLLLEPAVGVERRITDRFHLNLAVSYRWVNDVDQPGLEEGDLKGAAAILAAKFGQF
jgi:hypothetical protein